MHHLLGARRVAGVLLVALLSACSSGGGGEDGRSTQTSVSTNSLAFRAEAPDAATPTTQVVTATFGDDVAHLAVIHNGVAIASVSSAITGRTAQISVEPQSPLSLGSGSFSGSVAITGYFCADAACTSLAAGNTQSISVTYQISPLIQTIAPYLGVANVADSSIIRGVGFGSFAAQGVTFGGNAATNFVLVSDTEIRATYPALPAGAYEVQLTVPSHEGEIQSLARLVIVDPTLFAAQTLAYPAATTAVRTLLYDAERSALIVATDAGGGTLVRYEYAGGAWGPAVSTTIADLQDVALSTNGSLLLALTRASLVPVEPATLTPGTPLAAPSLATDTFLKNLAVTNDDRALITTGKAEDAATPLFIYSGRNNSLVQIGNTFIYATPAASWNGASLIFVQGHPTTTTAPPVFLFSSGQGQFSTTSTTLDQNDVRPVVDRMGTRAVLNGVQVHGTDFELFGSLPTTSLAAIVRGDGKRAYTYDSAAAGILTFDISADNNEAAYTPMGPAIPLAGDPGSGVRMAISPDGNTLFLAGTNQVVVQPTPVL